MKFFCGSSLTCVLIISRVVSELVEFGYWFFFVLGGYLLFYLLIMIWMQLLMYICNRWLWRWSWTSIHLLFIDNLLKTLHSAIPYPVWLQKPHSSSSSVSWTAYLCISFDLLCRLFGSIFPWGFLPIGSNAIRQAVIFRSINQSLKCYNVIIGSNSIPASSFNVVLNLLTTSLRSVWLFKYTFICAALTVTHNCSSCDVKVWEFPSVQFWSPTNLGRDCVN